MNWFTDVYQGWILSAQPWVIEPSIPGMLWLLAACGVLLFRRHLSWKSLIVTAVLATVLNYMDIDPRPLTQGMDFLPDFVRNLTFEAILIVLAWLFAIVLLVMSAFKSKRSVDRLIIGVATLAVSGLLYGYHMVVINGDLLTTLTTEDRFLMEVTEWDDQSFQSLCAMKGYDCLTGESGMRFEYPASKEINQQINDYLGFYRARSNGAIAFSFNRGLSVAEHPFAAAVVDNGEQGFRAIISRERPLYWMNSAKNIFGLISWTAQIFWISFALLTIGLHQLMIHKRKKRSPDTPEKSIESKRQHH